MSDESDNEGISTHRQYDEYEDSDEAESSSMAQRHSASISVDEEDLSDPELLSARDTSIPSKPAQRHRQTKKGPQKEKLGRRKQAKVKGKGKEVLVEEVDLRELDEEGKNHITSTISGFTQSPQTLKLFANRGVIKTRIAMLYSRYVQNSLFTFEVGLISTRYTQVEVFARDLTEAVISQAEEHDGLQQADIRVLSMSQQLRRIAVEMGMVQNLKPGAIKKSEWLTNSHR